MIDLFSFAGVSNTVTDVLFIVLFLIFSVVVLFAAVVLISKFIYLRKNAPDQEKQEVKFSFGGMLVAVLFFGLVIRLSFVFVSSGYREDLNGFISMTDNVLAGGFNTLLSGDVFRLFPVTAYLLGFFRWIASIFSITASSELLPFFIKLPFVLCDIASAAIIYFIAKKYSNEKVAITLAGFFSLFPVFIFASSVWGSAYSVLTMLMLLCFYFLANKNLLGIMISYSLAVLSHKDAIFFFPVIAVYVIYVFIKSCIAVHKAKEKGFKKVILNLEYRNILMPAYFILAVAFSYCISLPFMLPSNANFFNFLKALYFTPLGTLLSYGHNAMGIYTLFGQNGQNLVSTFPSAVIISLFAIIVSALVAIIYFSKKNRANLTYLAAYIILVLSIFYMDFSEMSLVPMLAILLVSFVLIKDKRILQIMGLLSFSVLLNASAVMAGAGYLNNLANADLMQSAAYTGSVLLSQGGWLAISIICTVLNMFIFVYATVVLLDFSMSSKRKLFADIEKPTIGQSLKNFII